MKIYGSSLHFGIPARTFVIDGSVAHPVLPFVQALEKEKFRLISEPGQNPILFRYGRLGKFLLSNELVPTLIMGKKFQRWDFTINVLVEAEIDQHGNHAITVVSNGTPRSSNDFVFETAGQAVNALAQSGHLLHVSEYFQGDPKTMKKQSKKTT